MQILYFNRIEAIDYFTKIAWKNRRTEKNANPQIECLKMRAIQFICFRRNTFEFDVSTLALIVCRFDIYF